MSLSKEKDLLYDDIENLDKAVNILARRLKADAKNAVVEVISELSMLYVRYERAQRSASS